MKWRWAHWWWCWISCRWDTWRSSKRRVWWWRNKWSCIRTDWHWSHRSHGWHTWWEETTSKLGSISGSKGRHGWSRTIWWSILEVMRSRNREWLGSKHWSRRQRRSQTCMRMEWLVLQWGWQWRQFLRYGFLKHETSHLVFRLLSCWQEVLGCH